MIKRMGDANSSCPQESTEDGRAVCISRETVRPKQETQLATKDIFVYPSVGLSLIPRVELSQRKRL